MKKQHNHLLIFGIIILMAIALHISGLTHHINLETLKANRQYLLITVQNNYLLSVLFYILLYIFITTFSLPVAAPLTLIGGFLFGTLGAILATNIGATIGATIVFLIFRYFFGNTIQKKYQAQLSAFNGNIERYGAQYLLLARLIVFIPFFLVNIGAGLTRIPLATFIWTTSLGIIPGSFVYAYAGKQIGTITMLADIFSVPVIIAFVLLIGLSIGSILVKNYLIKNKIIQ